jgi:hypothetical protein
LPLERRRQGEWPEKPSGKLVSLPGKTTVDDALEKIAEAAGWNLVANTGRAGDRLLVMRGKGIPVEEALDAVLEGTPLVATRRGNTVTVAPGSLPPPVELPVMSGFDKPSGKKFSGSFDDDEIAEALGTVAEAGGYSLVLPPGVRGTITAKFKDVPVEDVLKVLLTRGGLVAQREGTIVTVSRPAGGRLVISGQRRQIVFDGEDGEPGAEIGDAVAEALRQAGDQAKRLGKELDDRSVRKERDQVVSGNHTLKPGERAHNLVVLRGDVKMEAGSTAHQVTAVAGSVDLGAGASVEREVVAIFGDIHVGPGAQVGGDAVSIGGKIVIDEGGEVEGQQTSISLPDIGQILAGIGRDRPREPPSKLVRVLSVLGEFAVLFTVGLLFLLLVPRRLEVVSAALGNAPVKTVLTGFLGLLALLLLAILLAITFVGIPLALVLLVALMVAGVLGVAAAGMFVGTAAAARLGRGGQVLRLALGTALMVAVGLVPVLGCMAWVTAWLFGFGAVIRTRFGQPPPAAPFDTTVAAPPAPPAAA